MQIMKFDKDKHYDTICSWWEKHQWPKIPLTMLPQTGYIVDDLCAGFLYQTDSNIAWLEFIISNPESTKDDRSKALDILIDRLSEDARGMGFTMIFSSINHSNLINKYEKNGFNIADKNMTNMVRIL